MKNQALLICIFILTIFSTAFSQIVRLPMMKVSQDKKSHSENEVNFLEQGGMDIINNYNFNYLGIIKLGSQSTELKVVLDTGSSILWVRDKSRFGYGYNGFSCSGSNTCTQYPQITKDIYYGKGYMSGYKITEQLKLGNLTIPDHNLLLAQTVLDIQPTVDGILGLAMSETNPNYPGLLDRLKDTGIISTKTFSMFLGNYPNALGDVTGEIIFGGYDPLYATEEFRFVSVNDLHGHWHINLQQLSFENGASIMSRSLSVVFDSGTSLLLFPSNIVRSIVAQINKVNPNQDSCWYTGNPFSYQCSCSAVSSFTNLTFHFKGNSFSIPPSAYTRSSMGQCFLLIGEMQSMDGIEGILGDVFLINYYALYSVENKTVGLAAVSRDTRYPINKLPANLLFVVVIIVLFGVITYFGFCRKPKIQQQTRPVGLMIGGGSNQASLIRTEQEQL